MSTWAVAQLTGCSMLSSTFWYLAAHPAARQTAARAMTAASPLTLTPCPHGGEGIALAASSTARLALEPVTERLHGGAGLHESLAHGGHDLVGAGTVPVDADRVDLGCDGLPGDGRHLLLHGHAHRLVRGLGRIGDQGVLAELARDELAVVGIYAIGEALGGHPRLRLARLGVVLGHGHDHEDQVRVELLHLLGGGAAQLEVVLEHVVLDAVRLHVLERGARRLHEGVERAHLIAVEILDLLGRHVHAATAEAHEIGQPGMGADGHAVLEGQLHRLPHHVRIAPVKAAGHVGGGDVRHDALVVAEGPAAVALAHVAVDVDVCRHSFGKTSLATRSTCAGS